ncbi:MAG: hypothetical protein AAF480_15740 [Actinomycetota bacterium]
MDDDPVAVMDAYAARGWGDGLPLVPPTAGRVDAMLDALGDVDPDEVIAALPPRDGEATRRMIAVNAVLAGCAPAQLPVLVSAVRAIARDETNLRGVNATTHPVAPLLIVHGDIAATAGFNCGLGAFGPGNRANATTGRALRLILLHIAGAHPGPGDASTQGSPAKYGFCVAENVDASPWGGFAASVGVEADSAVTVHFGEGPHNFHDMESQDPERILAKCASAMTTTGQNNACISQGEYFVALCPEHAMVCSDHGWSRADVSGFLWEHARMPVDELRDAFDLLAWADWMRDLPDGAMAPMTESAANIRVFVAGGAGKHSCVMPSWGMTRSVTVAVEP